MKWNTDLLRVLESQGFPETLKLLIADTLKAVGADSGDMRVKRATVTLGEDPETKGSHVAASDFSIEDGERAVVQSVSTYHLDRDNEVVLPDGIDLRQFRKSGMAFAWNHNYSLGALGVDQKIGSDGGRIIAKSMYADTGEGTLPDVAFRLRQMGTSQSSIGFIPVAAIDANDKSWGKSLEGYRSKWADFHAKDEDIKRVITKSILLEHSDVFLASNFNTGVLAKARDCGADDGIVKQMFGVDVAGDVFGDPAVQAAAKEAAAKEAAEKAKQTKVAPEPPAEPNPPVEPEKGHEPEQVVKGPHRPQTALVKAAEPVKAPQQVRLIKSGQAFTEAAVDRQVRFAIDMASGKV